MKISIKAFPNANKNKVEQIDRSNYSVSVKEPPIGGRANQAIVEVLAHYFKIPNSKVSIISGRTSSKKVIEVDI